ncbi:sm LSM8 [Pelomyxa schiedti]|nr:sm LSM8 [Pelomyxa schiedti]
MTGILEGMVNQLIEVITNDGRIIVGTLRGYDQHINVILEKCHERSFSTKGVECVTLGLHVIRGDNIAVIGEVNEAIDRSIDLNKVRAEPLKPVQH